jgi:hypothetical protein
MTRPQGISSSERQAVPLLDVLLRIRQDMQQRRVGPYLYVGMPDVDWVATFIGGYGACLHGMGVHEGSDEAFGEWLRDVKKAWPGEGWEVAYAREFGGDPERALRKYLDFVAEFRALSPEALASIPYYGEGAHPSSRKPSLRLTRPPPTTLDFLLEIRRRVGEVQGRLGMYLGDITLRRMAGLLAGYRLCLALAGVEDEEYTRFEQWLQRAKDVPPGQTWEEALLQTCGGDPERAIRQLLAYAAEFRAAGP